MDRVLGSLECADLFRHACFEYHALVRLLFKLAAGFGEPWTRDGAVPQGCLLSMMLIVALYLPWCAGILVFRSEWSHSCMPMISSVFPGTRRSGGPLLDVSGSLQLLNSSHVWERDKALLMSVMVGGVWSGYLLGRVRGLYLAGFVALLMAMVTFFCDHAPFFLLLRFVKILNFMIS